ncbi:Cupredoxin [Halteromyces radiatus]|uniref:Cupredoxin n=1 Tax=Halteromyces radiatus TaxID=101107 RepID=UPI00221FE81E|nr:Cupredoxin [Halteromyces radiatus]KAI8077852.1 Cupredoxin [Halteromyces radiatus]
MQTTWIQICILLCHLTFALSAKGRHIQYYEFNITSQSLNADCSNYTETRTLLVNNKMPGPTITATVGQRIKVLVRNMLPPSTKADPKVIEYGGGNTNLVTIHYHGIRQYGSNQADGVPFLTQDPIPPCGQFLHDFVLDSSGTYFYHAHVGLQESSVFGAIVVYESDASNPSYHSSSRYNQSTSSSSSLTIKGINGSPDLTYHDDRVVVLSEWFHQDRQALESYLLGPNFTLIPEADSVLVNGQTINNERSIVSTNTFPCRGYSVINVQKNKTYRFRVIGASTFRTFGFAIADHRLQIIEADGGLIEPYETDYLEVSPGQRYSVLVHMNQPIKDYSIGTIRLWAADVDPTSNGWAILRYSQNDDDDINNMAVSSLPPGNRPPLPTANVPLWLWPKLKPLGGQPDPIALLPKPNRTIYLNTTNGPLSTLPGSDRFFINDVTFKDPSSTLLSQVLRGNRTVSPLSFQDLQQDDRRGYDPYLGTYPLASMEVVDFVIQNTHVSGVPCRSHPWHTHGHSHWLIAHGPGTYDEALHGSLRNIPFPVSKDTTLVYPDDSPLGDPLPDNPILGCGWSKIRLIADNPGIWAMHCHNTPHMFMGMMIVLEESTELIPSFLRQHSKL